MNYVKCSKGHFYDADQYPSCPYCGESHINETVTFSDDGEGEKTTPLNFGGANSTVSFNNVLGVTEPFEQEDDQKTEYVFSGSENSPIVGWLVCVEGSHKGEDFKLTAGKNSIGRGADMDVSLKGEKTVSRDKHAIIVYEPQQNAFLALPGDAKELFYLNGEVVLEARKMKKGDRIKFGLGEGQVELMFIPCCDESFSWS